MITRSTQCLFYLGLASGFGLAGTLALTPIASADIPITGGRTTGDAAFFVPNIPTTTPSTTSAPSTTPSTTPAPGTTPPKTVLFDAATRTLRIETPNGVTVNSRFIPTAGKLDGTSRPDGIPSSGDTGALEGVLSGRAFTTSGQPVFFQNVKTQLNFTLSAFNFNNIIGGTLITSTGASNTTPPVFLTLQNVTLSQSSQANFTSQSGNLLVGGFSANLDKPGGFIALPSTVQFQPSSVVVDPPDVVGVGRRTKYDLEGKGDLTSLDFNSGTGTLKFASTNAETKFKIESVGTPKAQEFQIDGKGTGVDVDINGVTKAKIDSNSPLVSLNNMKFEVKGEGVGITTLLANNSVSFASGNSESKFKLDNNNFKLDGENKGRTAFNVGVVPSTINQFQPASSTGTLTFNTTSSGQNPTTITPVVSTTTSTQVITSASSTTTSGTLFTTTASPTTQINVFLLSPVNVQVSRPVTYRIYESKGSKKVLVLGPGPGRGRGLALGRRGDKVVVYRIVGPTSRVFPGLVGITELSTSEVETLSQPVGGVTAPQLPAVDDDDDGGDDD